MKTYLCDWSEAGMVYCVQFEAVDWHQAERIAMRKGWTLVGEYVEEQDCPADVEAMIDRYANNPVIH